MANTLIPVEERTLTPQEVELLDKRRRRGQFLHQLRGVPEGRPIQKDAAGRL